MRVALKVGVTVDKMVAVKVEQTVDKWVERLAAGRVGLKVVTKVGSLDERLVGN